MPGPVKCQLQHGPNELLRRWVPPCVCLSVPWRSGSVSPGPPVWGKGSGAAPPMRLQLLVMSSCWQACERWHKSLPLCMAVPLLSGPGIAGVQLRPRPAAPCSLIGTFLWAALRSGDERRHGGSTKLAWFILFISGVCLKGSQHYQLQHHRVK